MVVARPVEPSSAEFQSVGSNAPIVPTKILTDPEELDRQLSQNGYTTFFTYTQEEDICLDSENTEENDLNPCEPEQDENENEKTNCVENEVNSPISEGRLIVTPVDVEFTLPETERVSVTLHRNEFGLGITVAGYVCEREDLCGIFVKGLNEGLRPAGRSQDDLFMRGLFLGSDAYKSGKINLNDRIVEVDGQPLQEFTNHEAVEKLKQTGDEVVLTLERYLRGPKYEHLQEALASQEHKDTSPASPSATTLSWIPIENTEV